MRILCLDRESGLSGAMMERKRPMEILVTGGSGFLGSAIVIALGRKHPDWRISVLDKVPPAAAKRELVSQFFQTDITSAESVNNSFADYAPDLVVHTAGIVPARTERYSSKAQDWEKVKRTNYDGTRNILDAAMAAGCRHFVYTSSSTVVADDLAHDYFYVDERVAIGQATLHYGKSKAMAETYVMSSKHREQGLKACALRPCTIIGPGDTSVISVMHDLIAKGETGFIVGDGNNLYDFMYVDNAVHAHVLAVENLLSTKTAAGHVFFVSNEEPVYFWGFLAYVWAQFGHVPRHRFHIPVLLAWVIGLILELITYLTGTASTLDRGSVQDGVSTRYANNDKARRILRYKPIVGLAEGVRLACRDYKKHLGSK